MLINSNRERSPWPVPPIGLCSVATGAAEAGHDVRFLDLCFEDYPEQAVIRSVKEFRPEVIGVSVRNIDNVDWQSPRFYLPDAKQEVVDPARLCSDCPIVIGGPPAGIMPEELLKYFNADFVIRGDGELSFPCLLEALGQGNVPDNIPGLVYRTNGTVRVNEPARVKDLDTLPMPQPHKWLDLRRYLAYNGSVGIQTKRGCSLKCSYCVYNQIEGSRYRLKSTERILREVEEAVNVGGARSIEFVDSTFNIPLDHAVRICKALAERKFPAGFSTMGINPGAVTEEFFHLLREANFTEVSITPETASPIMLKNLGKNFTVDDIVRTARISRKAKVPIVWYFMFGGPGENRQTVEETLAFIEKHVPNDHLVLMVTGIRIFKGAPLEKQARSEGQLAEREDLLEPIWYKPPIDRAELFELIDKALLRHPNYLALQDNRIPQALLRAAFSLHRFFHAKQPLWQYLRHLRRLMNTFGLPPHTMAHAKVSA